MSFSNADALIFLILIALVFCMPILFIFPFWMRLGEKIPSKKIFISLIYLEIPIGIIVICHAIYFSQYLEITSSFLNLFPYVFVLWSICYYFNEKITEASKILIIGWSVFVIVLCIHTVYLYKYKNEIDHRQEVHAALQDGNIDRLDVLWQKCPDYIDSIFNEMKRKSDYPGVSFAKVMQCMEKTPVQYSHLIDSSFEYSENINLLALLYNEIVSDEKKTFQIISSALKKRITRLKQCYSSECSIKEFNIILFLLTLEPELANDISINKIDLHNAIMANNKVNVLYFSGFVKPTNESDSIAKAVILGDEKFVIFKVEDRKLLLSLLGNKYGDDITILDYIIMNGSEKMLDFIIHDLNIDVNCYSKPNNIQYNNLSWEYEEIFLKKFSDKKCTHNKHIE